MPSPVILLPSAMRFISCCYKPSIREFMRPSILSTRISKRLSSTFPIRDPRTIAQWTQLTLKESEDPDQVRKAYRPYLLRPELEHNDWISQLELDSAASLSEAELAKTGKRLRVLVLYGELQPRSYSRLLALEASRILHHLGCDVRIYNPSLLPLRSTVSAKYPTGIELRRLSEWSEGHVWVTKHLQGERQTPILKNQLDWLRQEINYTQPSWGKTLSALQINDGPPNFDSLDLLRRRGQSMRMFTIRKQCSVHMASTAFDFGDDGHNRDGIYGVDRLLPSPARDSLVDCMEEFVKFSIVMRPHIDMLSERYSDRKEKKEKIEIDEKVAENIVQDA